MRFLISLVAFVSLYGLAKANGGGQSCNAQATSNCMDGSGKWTESGKCNAIYGNIGGNKNNLQALMQTQLVDSFKFMLMVNCFADHVVLFTFVSCLF